MPQATQGPLSFFGKNYLFWQLHRRSAECDELKAEVIRLTKKGDAAEVGAKAAAAEHAVELEHAQEESRLELEAAKRVATEELAEAARGAEVQLRAARELAARRQAEAGRAVEVNSLREAQQADDLRQAEERAASTGKRAEQLMVEKNALGREVQRYI